MGAFEQMLARATLDDEYSWREVVRTTLGLYLAVMALYRGDLDVRALLAPYESLLDEVAELPAPRSRRRFAASRVLLSARSAPGSIDNQMK